MEKMHLIIQEHMNKDGGERWTFVDEISENLEYGSDLTPRTCR